MKRKSRPKIPPKALRDLWDQIPSVECKGLCAESCGPIPCSSLERRLIEERAGKSLQADGKLRCTMLKDGHCSVYSIRPMICRIWGAVEKLKCPHGCRPERFLSDREAHRLTQAVEELAGDDHDRAVRDMLRGMTDPERQRWERSHYETVSRMVAEGLSEGG